jgi:choline dehydrogenase-like flavoprotein
VKNLDKTSFTVRARNYVVACGGVESPRLLLLSRSEHAPNGLGNQYDLVGRFFTEHPDLAFYGAVPGMLEFLPLEITRCHQYYELFKRKGLGSVLLVFSRSHDRRGVLGIGATIEMRPIETNRVTLSEDRRDLMGNPGAHLHLEFSAEDKRTLNLARCQIRSLYEQLGATGVTEEAITWSHHQMGTCRMGDDPRSSVVDRDLRLHGTSNLYVLGSSVFVTAGASHPTPLIVALAHRLAGHLTSKAPGPPA